MGSWRRLLRRRVIVNQDGRAFVGILYAQHGPLLILRNAELLQAGMEPQPLDGEVVVERSTVHFIQMVG